MTEVTKEYVQKIRYEQFLSNYKKIQRRYPAGTQFNLFAHLGHGQELILSKWDARRCANRWKCSLEEYQQHLQTLLSKQYTYFHIVRHGNDLKSAIIYAIVKYVKDNLNRDLYEWYREPTDRKVTKIIRDYFRNLPEEQKEIIVRIK